MSWKYDDIIMREVSRPRLRAMYHQDLETVAEYFVGALTWYLRGDEQAAAMCLRNALLFMGPTS